MIKVCINEHCDEVAHNIKQSEKRCRNCNGILVKINQKTYEDKFSKNWFQYDYETGELIHQQKKVPAVTQTAPKL